MDTKLKEQKLSNLLLQKEFETWCSQKNKSPKTKEEITQLFYNFMKEKHPEEYKQAMENQQKQQATKALHGAKLNYFKSLKHQCAEDEEVVYYKKGGSVTCGCKKKENGGEVKKNCGGSAITNFKMMRKGLNGMEAPTERKTATKQPKPQNNQQQKVKIYWTDLDDRKLDSLVTRKEIQKKSLTEQGEKDLKNLREKFKKADNKDQYEVDASEQPSKKCGGKVKKHQEGSIISKFKAYRKGGSLNGIPFYQEGTPKLGVRTKKEVDAINESNKNRAKSLFKGIFSGQVLPTAENLGNMISSAYNGWVDPETIYLTGEAPNIGGKNLLSLGKPFKAIKGVNYYKNAAGELKTAQEMAKELIAAKKVRPSWFPKERHTDHYVPKNATGIYNELEKAAYEGEQMMKNPFMNWKDFDEINSVNYWKHGGLIRK